MSSTEDNQSGLQQPAVDRYRTNELSFTLPPGLKDKTHHVFTITDSGPSPFTLVISHSPIAPEDTLETISKRLVLELGRSLQQFRTIQEPVAVEVAGQHGCRLEYSWMQQGVKMQQKQVCLLHEIPGKRQLIQVAGTSSAQGEHGLDWALRFEQIVATVQLRLPEE
ncbi:DcrB-related protein [Collimonas arenae]|uniref:DcrB-related protein n=1 Tax=Collimonas arenae TaxID=279058 RepID=UPI00068C3E15|nr:DcrB-related protein [Collimonas arenae]